MRFLQLLFHTNNNNLLATAPGSIQTRRKRRSLLLLRQRKAAKTFSSRGFRLPTMWPKTKINFFVWLPLKYFHWFDCLWSIFYRFGLCNFAFDFRSKLSYSIKSDDNSKAAMQTAREKTSGAEFGAETDWGPPSIAPDPWLPLSLSLSTDKPGASVRTTSAPHSSAAKGLANSELQSSARSFLPALHEPKSRPSAWPLLHQTHVPARCAHALHGKLTHSADAQIAVSVTALAPLAHCDVPALAAFSTHFFSSSHQLLIDEKIQEEKMR